MFKKFIVWLVYSSDNPDKFGKTLYGIITGSSTFIIWAAAVSPLHLMIIDGQITYIAVAVGGIVSALLTLIGLTYKLLKFVESLFAALPAPDPVPAPVVVPPAAS